LHRRHYKEWPESVGPPDPQVGAVGVVKLLDVWVGVITSPMLRHVIKRYLRRTGFRDLVVEHLPSDDYASLRLVARGRPVLPLSSIQLERVLYLHDSVLYLLGNRAAGPPPLTTAADAESLRLLLAKEDPRLRKVYHGRPPAA
jgi:hypothetical protein